MVRSKLSSIHVIFLGLVFLIEGCSGSQTGTAGQASIPDIAFSSSGSLDGSNAVNNTCTPFITNHGFISTNGFNLWGVNASGSLRHPMSKLTACAISTSDLAWAPDGSKIAFSSNRALNGGDGSNGANPNIWLMNADGTGTALLHTPTVFATGPTWSPDGITIAFFAGNFWTVKADGSGANQLTKFSNVALGGPMAWSSDGHKLAFVSDGALDGSNSPNANLDFNIWLMNADGSALIPLTKYTYPLGALAAFDLAWSKDGSKIAFSSISALDGSNASNGTINTSNIWVMNPDGTNATPLTMFTSTSAQGAFSPAWSPDSKKIAYLSGGNIWVINADGTAATQLTHFTGADTSSPPSWSPDGTRLVFDSTNAMGATSNFNIWLINADGSGLVSLTQYSNTATSSNGATAAVSPVWRP